MNIVTQRFELYTVLVDFLNIKIRGSTLKISLPNRTRVFKHKDFSRVHGDYDVQIFLEKLLVTRSTFVSKHKKFDVHEVTSGPRPSVSVIPDIEDLGLFLCY